MSEKKKRLVAYHEAGHALVGALMPEYDPVTKISIVPRGAAGGLTFFAPSEERLESGLYSRTYFENQVGIQAVYQCAIGVGGVRVSVKF
jgi:cell division protease FtsH